MQTYSMFSYLSGIMAESSVRESPDVDGDIVIDIPEVTDRHAEI